MKILRLSIMMLSVLVLSSALFAVSAYAQTPENAEVKTPQAPVNPREIPSLLFTHWEHSALVDAKKDAESIDPGVQRGVTEEEMRRAMREKQNAQRPKPPPEQRELRLGGILYTDQDDWTIWLNERRITPNALPEEIISLRVRRHYIDVKWYDDYTARVFPIRLRAHQRFNLDSRIFLPG